MLRSRFQATNYVRTLNAVEYHSVAFCKACSKILNFATVVDSGVSYVMWCAHLQEHIIGSYVHVYANILRTTHCLKLHINMHVAIITFAGKFFLP